MAVTPTEEFRREAVKIALSSGLSRTRVAADLVRKNERLRLENRVLREEREILKKPRSFSRAQRHEVRLHP
ncbi:transposase [Gluconobacter thailandicus F149-1 = NBRC 100600]|nr:transposase [Gluconobacter thailandicus F149-1 = NBRC 100600]GBR60713.1 transposase [Gluconobacter thailandicus F149-1 = NBRC 100600]GEL88264.1 hypothetical protein GTH01_26220 [Gluconobacter thailandicus F149-1 = NBRC 100600]